MSNKKYVEVAVIGAGMAGIATAYYLCVEHQRDSVVLIDSRQPMSFTSAQSGDNYRNWWPHPTMVAFTNDSIALMEGIARETSNILDLTQHGYVLATRRSDIDDLIADLVSGYGEEDSIRTRDRLSGSTYSPVLAGDWTTAPDGVDVLSDPKLIRKSFPSFHKAISNVIHIRRAGDFSGQQLGQFMLGQINNAGGKRIGAAVQTIEENRGYRLTLDGVNGIETINADVIVNAAGPFARNLAKMIGVDLPIHNVFQQKIAFEDERSLVPRNLPFAIDLDEKTLEWTDEERNWLASEPDLAWLTREIVGGIHCRPEGGPKGKWIKLGWAYNTRVSEPKQDLANEPYLDSQFPEIVMRGAAVLQPALTPYVQKLPTRRAHYGGYYSMTPENWPLIGPLNNNGAFVVGALSGFGSMSACAAGALCARHITGGSLPEYALPLSLARYDDDGLMKDILSSDNRGIL